MWKLAIDEVKGPKDRYKKKMTKCYNEDGDIAFEDILFKRGNYIKYKKTEELVKDNDENYYFYRADLERWKVTDLGKYTKPELLQRTRDFLLSHDLKKLMQRIDIIRRSQQFIEAYQFKVQQEYTSEYLQALHTYKTTRRNLPIAQEVSKKRFCNSKKDVVFRIVDRNQVNFFRKVMKDPVKRNLTLD